MDIYLVRHIEKLDKRFTNYLQDDLPVTKRGLEFELPDLQEFVQRTLQESGAHNSFVMASPARRSRVTARGVLDVLEEERALFWPDQYQEFDFLRETDKGPIRDIPEEQLPRAYRIMQIEGQKQRKQSINPFTTPYPFGESAEDVVERIKKPITEVISHLEHDKGAEKIFIVGHSGNLQLVAMLLAGHEQKWTDQERFLGTGAVRQLTGTISPDHKQWDFEDRGLVHGDFSKVLDYHRGERQR